MKIFKSLIIIFLIFNFNLVEAKDNEIESKITKNLRCLICQGQSVYDSDSEFALSLKLVVKTKIEEGLSEKQIYDFLREKYGEWILYDPSFDKNTYFLWLMPLLIFLLGGAIIIKKLIIKKQSIKNDT
jgi:cytochrome c-type biogenesis protein CcmH